MKTIILSILIFCGISGAIVAQETPPDWNWGDGKPILASPVPNSTLSACMRHGFVNVLAFANNPQARKLQLRVFLNDPRTLKYERKLQWSNPEEEGHLFELVFRGDETPGLHYLLELRSEDADGNLLAYRYFTLFTQQLDDVTPQFIYPASEETGVSRQPLIAIKPYPAHTCCPLYGLYFEIDRYPADWQGSDYQTEQVDTSVHTWRVPRVLDAATMYEVRVKFLAPCERGNVNGFVSATRTFTTGTAMPQFGDPILVSPEPYSASIPICGRFTWVKVIPNHSDARTLSVRIFRNDPREFETQAGGSLNADEAVDTLILPLHNTLFPSEQYLIEVGTLDKAGNLLRQKYFTIFTPSKSPGDPQLIFPVDQQTHVSLTPTIQIKPFPSDACGRLEVVEYTLFGPGGYVQKAEFTQDNNTYSWTVPQPLQPYTRYSLWVQFKGPGLTPIGDFPITRISFTTGGSSSRTSLNERLASVVFPNPVTEQTTVRIRTSADPLTIQVLVWDGRTLLEKTVSGGSVYPLTLPLSQGLYMLRITDPKGHREQFRIVKQ